LLALTSWKVQDYCSGSFNCRML